MTKTQWQLTCSWSYAFLGVYWIHSSSPVLRATGDGLAPAGVALVGPESVGKVQRRRKGKVGE